MKVTLHHGNCIDVLKGMADASVDSIVTDPPYGLGFMDKVWDTFKSADVPMRRNAAMDSVNTGSSRQGGRQRSTVDYQRRQANDMREFQAWCETWAVECLRVLKPGGHILAFGGTRTYHRLASAIEDAGFEIRDCLAWLHGQGFPKSRNGPWGGTALKPAHEPVVMARKSTIGTVEDNWLEYGTGALNIDGCRVPFAGEEDQAAAAQRACQDQNAGRNAYGDFNNGPASVAPYLANMGKGRWPANLLHDGSPEVVALFPQSAGQLADESATAPSAKFGRVFGMMGRAGEPSAESDNDGAVGFKMRPGARRGDLGSAARFFWNPKASRTDRNEGCELLPDKLFGMSSAAAAAAARGEHYDNGDGGVNRTTLRANNHPTVKPTELMRYLVRLVTPPGGTVLDPFLGSGSTGKAAVLEGFNFIGIELNPEYIEIARARIDFAARQGRQETLFAEVQP